MKERNTVTKRGKRKSKGKKIKKKNGGIKARKRETKRKKNT